MSTMIDGNGGGTIALDNDDNFVRGEGGDDVILGAGGDDTLKGGNGDDSIKGSNEADTVTGGKGDDTLNGGQGDDDVVGGEGNDKLSGSAGDDMIFGGGGNNRMAGGDGADTFVFDADSTGKDKILDFEVGVDDIRLNGVTVTEVVERSDGSAFAQLDTGGMIIFKGLTFDEVNDLFF